jgi:hypothetical protein
MATLATTTGHHGVRSSMHAGSDVLHAEWTKMRTVRSTSWSLLIVLAGTIVISLLLCSAIVGQWDRMSTNERANLDPTSLSLAGLFVGRLAIGVLGVLTITAEYATGIIRSTFAAVPRRATVLAAKAAVLAVVGLVFGTIACGVAFLAGQAILGTKGAGVSLLDPHALRAVIGGGLYLATLGLLGLGLGTILRHTAGAISAFVGTVLVLPGLMAALPDPWHAIVKFLPSEAGQALVSVRTPVHSLSPWAGFAVLFVWAAAALGLGAHFIGRRDA